MNLANKRVLITAAAQGIGRASVLALRDAGARVIATDLHIEALHDIPGIHALPLDVTRAADIDAISRQVGTIDVLFNCAGYVHSGALLDCDEQAWQFYKQFALTIAISTVISAFNSLTLSPALAAVLLKGHPGVDPGRGLDAG